MFATVPFLETLGWTLLASAGLFTGSFVVSRLLRRNDVADTAWGLSFALVAVVATALSSGHGDDARRYLVLGMVVLWAGRLAGFIAWRSRSRGDDPRYEKMLSRKGSAHPALTAFVKVFVLQSVIAWFVAMPVTISAFNRGGPTALAWVGVAVWAVGLFFESVGDLQLQRWKRDPANDGLVMDRGLWRYTRHPNYFGDACVWTGVFLVAAEHLPGVATILSPVVMTYLLTAGSGKRVTERKMAEEKPGFAAYVARTSGFFPLPPKRLATRPEAEHAGYG